MRRSVRAVFVCVVLAAALGASHAVAQLAFALNRIELIFPNGRGDITIPLRYPEFRAYALLQFTGNGFVQGNWKVDGRIIGPIAEPVVFGEMLILASPVLPTFEQGLRRLTLEVTEPKPAFKIPVITYFVTGEEYEEFKKRMERAQ